MRAAVCREYGPPEVVRVEDLPPPALGPGQVRVGVRAAAVNYPDVLLVAGEYQVKLPVPFVPGSEYAGIVTEVAVPSNAPDSPMLGDCQRVVSPATIESVAVPPINGSQRSVNGWVESTDCAASRLVRMGALGCTKLAGKGTTTVSFEAVEFTVKV